MASAQLLGARTPGTYLEPKGSSIRHVQILGGRFGHSWSPHFVVCTKKQVLEVSFGYSWRRSYEVEEAMVRDSEATNHK